MSRDTAGLDQLLKHLAHADAHIAIRHAEFALALAVVGAPGQALVDDDPSTAFALMFHDPDWEDELLQDALAGPAFFVGAVGARATHARRCERLRNKAVGVDAGRPRS
ncbi:MAG: hypothetical protein GC206_05040 [Alphaproteobacteria bacterium]|nr:hypothetical protein [Alphaproteobacteria bacterium]